MALTDNIVAYWKLDEASGNATDATGNGHTLTPTNSPTYDSGLINNGGDFGPGSGSVRKFTTAGNIGIDGGNITMSAWFFKLSGNTQAGWAVSCGSSVSQVLYYIQYDGTKIVLGRWKVPSSNITINGSSLTDGSWHHVVLTYNGTTLAGYFDNSPITGTATSGNGSSGLVSETSIGNNSQPGASAYRGKIDEVGMWSRALSSGEVNTLYNSGAGLQYPFSVTPTNPARPSFLFNFC